MLMCQVLQTSTMSFTPNIKTQNIFSKSQYDFRLHAKQSFFLFASFKVTVLALILLHNQSMHKDCTFLPEISQPFWYHKWLMQIYEILISFPNIFFIILHQKMHLRIIQLLLQKKSVAQLVYAQEAICFALSTSIYMYISQTSLCLYSLCHDDYIHCSFRSIFMKKIPQKCLHTLHCDISTKNDMPGIITTTQLKYL